MQSTCINGDLRFFLSASYLPMNNEPHPYRPTPGKNRLQLPSEGFIDFFQAIRQRTVVLPLAGRIMQLIEEYSGTAKRVDSELDELILLKVINALMRESLEEPSPLQEISNEEPTRKFLAESLYNDIREERDFQRERSSLFSPEEWRASLEHVADSFLEDATPFLTALNDDD